MRTLVSNSDQVESSTTRMLKRWKLFFVPVCGNVF